MARSHRPRTHRGTLTALAAGVCVAVLPGLSRGQEPASSGVTPPRGGTVRTDPDPLRRRSATENVVFGQIVSTDDHRLTLREGEGDSATETVYRLSPKVRVYVQNKQVELNELSPETRIRFPRVTDPDGEVSEIYAVEADDLASPNAPDRIVDAEPAPAPTRVVREGDSPSVDNDLVPDVDLGATLETTTEGVEVVRLDPISPLRDAGLKEGDFIKTAAGQSVVTPKALFRVLNEFDGSATVALSVRRDGQEQEFTVTLPADHKKVLVDTTEDVAPVADRNNLAAGAGDHSSPRLLQQIRRTQEQQQAQLKYLYDGLMQLARATGVNQGVFGNSAYPFGGGVLPLGGFGADGTGSNGNCYGAIGFDDAGNPVIGVSEAGVAIGVFGFNENGYPILRETTLVTPANGGNGTTTGVDTDGDGVPDDFNGDGRHDNADGDGLPAGNTDGVGQTPVGPPPETTPAAPNNPNPTPSGPPFTARPRTGQGTAAPATPRPSNPPGRPTAR